MNGTGTDSLSDPSFLKRLKAVVESKWGSRLIFFGLIPALFILSLLLPPISLWQRVAYGDYSIISRVGGVVEDAYGAQLMVPGGALQNKIRLRFTSVGSHKLFSGLQGTAAASAAESIPPDLEMVSPFYRVDKVGNGEPSATLSLPILARMGDPQTLDLFVWTGQEWRWVPSQVEGQEVMASLSALPEAAALMRVDSGLPTVSAILASDSAVEANWMRVLSEVNPRGFYVRSDGTIGGDLTTQIPLSRGRRAMVLPTVGNEVDGVLRSDWVDNILANGDLRTQHVETLIALAQEADYRGINLDYRGIDPELRSELSLFITELADTLHDEVKVLSVILPTPVHTPDGGWDTGAYDWQTIGQAADSVKITAPTDPNAYARGGQAESLLRFAVGEVDRRKIEWLVSAGCLDQAGDETTLVSYDQAVAHLLKLAPSPTDKPIVPGESVVLDLPELRRTGGIHFDPALQSYWFTYNDGAGLEHKVWLEDASSLGPKLDLVNYFSLRGVSIQELSDDGADQRIWNVLASYHDDRTAPAVDNNLALVWTVKNPAGGAVLVHTTEPTDAELEWTAPSEPGIYYVDIGISNDGGQTVSTNGHSIALQVAAPTPTPVPPTPTPVPPTPTPVPPTPTPVPLTPTPTPAPATPTPQPTNTPLPTPTPEPFAVVLADVLNLRAGPGTNYDVISKLKAGDQLSLVERTQDGEWVCVENPNDEGLGWVFASLVDIPVSPVGIPVAKSIPPTPTPRPKPKAPARVATSPVRVGRGVDYGVQVDMITASNHGQILGAVQQIGFHWIKQQVEWYRIEPAKGQYKWGALDAIVNAAEAAGIKVLFSVVKAPRWARPADSDFSVQGPPANPQDFADFLFAMAGRYKGRVAAYEVWNEQNLWYEWGGRGNRLSASKYVELLKPAYLAIKRADPGAVVVSGALTPTGWNDGDTAIDDQVYLEQMYQAGLRGYCDAVGAHPSGYNNPPDADWRTYQDPSKTFGAAGHPSWYFRGTMEGYRNIMVKYGDGDKAIWPTEFGWASIENLTPNPAGGYEYARDNTEAEQAQYLVKAFEMAKAWGWVGPMFVWNLNFGPVAGAADEKAAFGIVRADWSPRPAFAALANMPK